jgi:NADP-dependent 3-hydroxy acid dehydrogenase YdfG
VCQIPRLTQSAQRNPTLHITPLNRVLHILLIKLRPGVSSISALVGGAQQTHYTPTKAGVLSLMQSCACALGKYGIRCNDWVSAIWRAAAWVA